MTKQSKGEGGHILTNWKSAVTRAVCANKMSIEVPNEILMLQKAATLVVQVQTRVHLRRPSRSNALPLKPLPSSHPRKLRCTTFAVPPASAELFIPGHYTSQSQQLWTPLTWQPRISHPKKPTRSTLASSLKLRSKSAWEMLAPPATHNFHCTIVP